VTARTGDHEFEVLDRVERFAGNVISVVSETVAMPGGRQSVRDYVRHTGAVATVALDGSGRVILVRQYRHPVRRQVWELPAGLLDVAGEPALATAKRELHEEADLTAARWHVLVDLLTTPGCSDEAIRVFLARDLAPVPEHERHDRHDEEALMTSSWFGLDTAVDMVLRGEIENAACCAGLLAAARARDAGWSPLRPADSPWPAKPEVAEP
jgi:8-oxo-dGTP pyrophosphatase MutT (NUDIX family)